MVQRWKNLCGMNLIVIEPEELNYSSQDKAKLVKTRINQNFFRSSVLSAYNNACVITRIKINEFLVASHIKPWVKDENNRLNPHNGEYVSIQFMI